MRAPALHVMFFVTSSLLFLSLSPSVFAQTISVTSANPNNAPQGTLNLNVVISGNGFKKGARAVFYLSGTTSTDGIAVNSTAFNGSTQVTSNINVADTATTSSFDVVVYNTDGRSGKGTKLFSVTAKGTPIGCTNLGTPGTFTLVTTLNYVNSSGAPQYQPHLGTAMAVRPVTLTNGVQSRAVIVAAVGSGNNNGKMEFFFLDPATGQILDGQSLLGGPIQPHIIVFFDPIQMAGVGKMAGGDLNGDGIPDFVAGNNADHAFIFLGSMDSNGILSFGPAITLNSPSSSQTTFGSSVAMGNLDGGIGDELAVGAIGGGKHGSSIPGQIFLYKLNGTGVSLIHTVDDPLSNSGDQFGSSINIGDVTGDGVSDLIVGAQGATVGSATAAGMVIVFPSPLTSTTYFTLTAGISGDNLGFQLRSGMLSSSTATDVIATTGFGSSTTNPRALVFSGPITGNRTASSFEFLPYPGLTGGWATFIDAGDMTGDGRVEVLVGAPNATNSNSCNSSVGAAHLYLSNPSNPSLPALTIFQPPTVDPNFGGFGYSVGLVPFSSGNPSLFLVGENGRDVGGITGAGQVYVYRKN